ncbi:MAG: hypothetical protein HYZ81_09595 [Nitrospinae bacterium]|nr:hypothetical protein [Nitrospinota bacterium]
MKLRIVTMLALLVAISFTVAAAQKPTAMPPTKTAPTTETTKSPSAQEVQKKLGPEFQFLLASPSSAGGKNKVRPRDALILRELCGTCTPNPGNPWSTVVKTRADGTTVTLSNLYQMHQAGRRWGEIAQRELGVKLGTQVRESANRRHSMASPSSSASGAKSGGASETGVSAGSSPEVGGQARGETHRASSGGHAQGK